MHRNSLPDSLRGQSGTDIDGFRVDTPMQVPLNFYKTWCPAMREHAASVGKHRFGIFGEFFVSVQRRLRK